MIVTSNVDCKITDIIQNGIREALWQYHQGCHPKKVTIFKTGVICISTIDIYA